MLLLFVFGNTSESSGDHPTSVTWIPSAVGSGGALVSDDLTLATWTPGDAPVGEPIYLTTDDGAYITTDSGVYIILGYTDEVTISVGNGGTAVIVDTGNNDSTTVDAGGRPLSSVWAIGDSTATSVPVGDTPTTDQWVGGDVALSPIYLTTDAGDYITTDDGVYIITGYTTGDNATTISTGDPPTTVTW